VAIAEMTFLIADGIDVVVVIEVKALIKSVYEE
jgi:hypothetical protein